MWHLLKLDGGHKEVLCDAPTDEDLLRTRACWTSSGQRSLPELICPTCVARMTDEHLQVEIKEFKPTAAKPPKKKNMAAVRKILKRPSPAGKYESNYD